MITFRLCDFENDIDCKSYLRLLQQYIKDPMGDGTPLSPTQEIELLELFREQKHSFVVLAQYESNDVGFSTCFQGISTFRVAPTINIHDFFVNGNYRGVGLGQKLMDEIVTIAKNRNCAKITLEVREDNEIAQRVYSIKDFKEETTKMLFWTKYL